MGHTSGPWAVIPYEDLSYGIDAKDAPIGTITWREMPDESPDPAMFDDACLIAAAPELLEALKGAVEWMEHHTAATQNLQRAREAIKSAQNT